MSVLDKLQWRYATKKFDGTKQIPTDQLNIVLEAIRFGTKFLRITTLPAISSERPGY